MQSIQDWAEAYKELCDLIKNPSGVPEIEHIDLDNNQLDNEGKEYPLPTNTVLLDFGVDGIDTLSLKVQDMKMRIGVTYAFKTISDTFKGSPNQNTGLAYAQVLRKIHNLLQGRSGTNFSALDRVDFQRAPAPPYVTAYKMTYACIIRDYAAMKEYDESNSLQDLNVTLDLEDGTPPSSQDTDPLFTISM